MAKLECHLGDLVTVAAGLVTYRRVLGQMQEKGRVRLRDSESYPTAIPSYGYGVLLVQNLTSSINFDLARICQRNGFPGRSNGSTKAPQLMVWYGY